MKLWEKNRPAAHLQLANFIWPARSEPTVASFISHIMFEQLKNSLAMDPRCICSVEFDLALFNNETVFSLVTCKEFIHKQSRTCWWDDKISEDASLFDITLSKHIFMPLTRINSKAVLLLRDKPLQPADPMSGARLFSRWKTLQRGCLHSSSAPWSTRRSKHRIIE